MVIQQSGAYCREFQSEVVVGGEKQNAHGTACREPDGSWRIVSSYRHHFRKAAPPG